MGTFCFSLVSKINELEFYLKIMFNQMKNVVYFKETTRYMSRENVLNDALYEKQLRHFSLENYFIEILKLYKLRVVSFKFIF